jgi:hypothetical protein
MRAWKWAAASILALGMTGVAKAEILSWGGSGFFGRQNQIVTPVATDIPISGSQSSSFLNWKLGDFIPKFYGVTNQQVIGQSTFPTYNDMPGADYLKAFHYGRGVSIVP